MLASCAFIPTSVQKFYFGNESSNLHCKLSCYSQGLYTTCNLNTASLEQTIHTGNVGRSAGQILNHKPYLLLDLGHSAASISLNPDIPFYKNKNTSVRKEWFCFFKDEKVSIINKHWGPKSSLSKLFPWKIFWQ